jgi:hypothetical protein
VDDRFLVALAVTIAVETSVLLAAVRLVLRGAAPSVPRTIAAGALASSWSLPYLWLLLPNYVSGWAYLPVGELSVVAGEALVYRLVLSRRLRVCVGLSAACNLASYLAGLALSAIWR